MTTLAQVVAQHGGALASVLEKAITSWCSTATPEQIKAAFFPERAGVEIYTPGQDLPEEPKLQGVGAVYVILQGDCAPYTFLTESSEHGEVPFLFHNKETAREMAKAHNIPFGNIVPAEMWKLDQ